MDLKPSGFDEILAVIVVVLWGVAWFIKPMPLEIFTFVLAYYFGKKAPDLGKKAPENIVSGKNQN